MNTHLPRALTSLFRPGDEARFSGTGDPVPFHRLLGLFGAVLASSFGILQMVSSAGGAVPTGPSFLIGGLFLGIVAASYVAEPLRRSSVVGTRLLVYGLVGWIATATVLEGFPEGHAATLLFAYAALTPAVGYGGRSIGPALWLGGIGLGVVAGGALLTASPDGRPLFLLGSMVTAGLVEGLAAKLMVERRAPDQFDVAPEGEASLPSVTENAPAALVRTVPGKGIVYANRALAEAFGYGGVDEVLRADLDDLFADPEERERLWTRARQEGEFERAEVTLTRKDQSTFTGLLSARVAYGGEGEVVCCDVIVTDITDRKRREEARQESMKRLARTAEQNDYGTDGHVWRVGRLARLLARALDQPPEWQERIERAAPFHDVGKIGIADRILRKSGPLSAEERQAMKEHASIGPALLSGGASERIQMARRIARSHHERWDGDGYPDGLSGEGIPLEARIVAVADAFDAMTHDRPYRDALSPAQAFAAIEAEAGAQFDPQVSEAALQCREAMTEIVTDADGPAGPASRRPGTNESTRVTASLSAQPTG